MRLGFNPNKIQTYGYVCAYATYRLMLYQYFYHRVVVDASGESGGIVMLFLTAASLIHK